MYYYFNTAGAGCITIFSSDGKFHPVSKLHLTLAARSYAFLLLLLLAKVYTFENFTTTLRSAQHGLHTSPLPVSCLVLMSQLLTMREQTRAGIMKSMPTIPPNKKQRANPITVRVR